MNLLAWKGYSWILISKHKKDASDWEFFYFFVWCIYFNFMTFIVDVVKIFELVNYSVIAYFYNHILVM